MPLRFHGSSVGDQKHVALYVNSTFAQLSTLYNAAIARVMASHGQHPWAIVVTAIHCFAPAHRGPRRDDDQLALANNEKRVKYSDVEVFIGT